MKKLSPSRCKPAELVRIIYDVVPEHGTPFEDILKPEYWANVAGTLAPGALIQIIAEDNSYFAELLVKDAGRLWASVVCLRKVELHTESPVEETSTVGPRYDIQWAGAQRKYAVFRKAGKQAKEIIADGFATRTAAQQNLAEHMTAISA